MEKRKCLWCGCEYMAKVEWQMYCTDCKRKASNERQKKWYRKHHPNWKPKMKSREKCCVCGEPFNCSFDGKPYCRIHYGRMRKYGDPELHPKKHGNPYEIKDGIVIYTTHDGRQFTSDICDLETIQRYTWSYTPTGYLVANINHKPIKLHRYLLNPADDMVVDHINGDRSDYRRCNMRVCTRAENARNISKHKNNKNRYIGVSKATKKKYRAEIMFNRKRIHLGYFDTEEEAYAARVEAEKKYFGEFRRQTESL